MNLIRLLARKVALPLGVAGVTLLSGVAVAVPSIAASANSITAGSTSCTNMHYEGCSTANMHYE